MSRIAIVVGVLPLLLTIGCTACAENRDTDPGTESDGESPSVGVVSDWSGFEDAMAARVEAAGDDLDRLVVELADERGEAEEGWGGRVEELMETRSELKANLTARQVDPDGHDEARQELVEDVSDFEHRVDEVILHTPGTLSEFEEAVENRLNDVDSRLGILTQEILLLDFEIAGGFLDELRELETARDQIHREAVVLFAALEDDPAEERRELAEELIELRREVRELAFELQWDIDIDPPL